MSPATSGRNTFTPAIFSKARRTASLLNVPPCTTTLLPISDAFRSLITLKSAFLITEYESPAEMSATVAPSFCACLTRLFINTVHLVPKSTGFGAINAILENSCTLIPIVRAKLSKKLPQPEEQASFSWMEVMAPSFILRHFMS